MLGNFVPNSDFFIGPIRMHWYGVLMAAAIAVSFFTARKFSGRFGIKKDDIEDVLPWLVFAGLAGARLYFVIFSWDFFRVNPGLIFQIWRGGISIYGAVIAGALILGLFAKLKRINIWALSDTVVLALPLGQAIGRFGNFFNQEAFGRPTNLPWRMFVDFAHRPPQFQDYNFFHPTFLYESGWDFFVFAILLYLCKRSPRPAVLTAGYLALYPVGRFFIETLRVDSFFLVGFRVDQLVSLALMTVAAGIFIFKVLLQITDVDQQTN